MEELALIGGTAYVTFTYYYPIERVYLYPNSEGSVEVKPEPVTGRWLVCNRPANNPNGYTHYLPDTPLWMREP